MTTRTRLLDTLCQRDLQLLAWFVRAPHRQLWVTGARAFSRSGDGTLQLLLPLLMWIVDGERGLLFASMTLFAFTIERPLYWVLKNTCRRRRPPEAIPDFQSVIHAADRFSFPSGHTTAAFLLATLCALCYGPMAAPLYAWAACVGLSRVVLGVHFPSDILAGALLGCGIGWLVWT